MTLNINTLISSNSFFIPIWRLPWIACANVPATIAGCDVVNQTGNNRLPAGLTLPSKIMLVEPHRSVIFAMVTRQPAIAG